MIFLNPRKHSREYPDERSREIMLKTIEFFENKGRQKLKHDDHKKVWYADFLEFLKEEKIFWSLLTPEGYGDQDCRWDMWRLSEFAEILGFYGLHYWYTFQVTILGLGPIWMSGNEDARRRAAQFLKDGEVFAFGLSEKDHGADVYATEMALMQQEDGSYRANGAKYYIGNANEAKMVSTLGKMGDTGDYVFFIADYRNKEYDLIQNVVDSQSYVAEYALHDYPVSEAEILSKGTKAWDDALNTVNVGKYNLGWASIGICTHAFYEALDHAANRRLYNMYVTDFSHVKRMFTDAYARLVAMKLFGLRTADYMRSASLEDRRYLLYDPIMKMKVTTQGEEVINLLWDVIAAKGCEKDLYFEMATRDIRWLPKLEGTVHVNIALVLKFMTNYMFNPAEYPEIPMRNDPKNDDFLFEQGPTRGLGDIRFHDYNLAYDSYDLPNVKVFKEQIAAFKDFLAKAAPDSSQTKDVDFQMAVGEIFTLIAYGQLVLENSRIYDMDKDVVDQIFDFMVRDFSEFTVGIYSKPSSTDLQMEHCLKMVRKPAVDEDRYERVWKNHVYALKGQYQMND